MKLSGNAEIQKERGHHVTYQITGVVHFGRRERQMQIDQSVQDQVKDTSGHPINTDLVDTVGIIIVIIATESLVIDYWKERKTDVRQHEKVRQRLRHRRRGLVVTNLVEIQNEPEHEHGTEDGPDRFGPKGR